MRLNHTAIRAVSLSSTFSLSHLMASISLWLMARKVPSVAHLALTGYKARWTISMSWMRSGLSGGFKEAESLDGGANRVEHVNELELLCETTSPGLQSDMEEGCSRSSIPNCCLSDTELVEGKQLSAASISWCPWDID